ncbi:hypothetical protein CFP56_031314 [Quercus suber]|uniref:Uncharacterized protein n=1 Tax=Quercus suber TaxID=58331 RepID=A0AAW0JL60_QUESU
MGDLRDLVSWTAMVSCFANNDLGTEAIVTFLQMGSAQVYAIWVPNEIKTKEIQHVSLNKKPGLTGPHVLAEVELADPAGDLAYFPAVEIGINELRPVILLINISLTYDKSYKIILHTGTGECVLPVTPPGEGNSIFILPSYDKLLTPVNGAYFLILTVLVFGGTWACCKFRKKNPHGGVPYQELEMGLPEESVPAINVETAEGWDEGWDDDWDGDNAVKSPGGRHVGSISANGLTSRSSNKDGWENDWNA